MKTEKHTPGPWREGIDGNPRIYGPDGQGLDAGLIAVVYKGRPNAHLIAAAPELLEDARERERSDGWFIDQLRELCTLPLSEAQREKRISSIIAHVEAHRIGTAAVIAKAEPAQ